MYSFKMEDCAEPGVVRLSMYVDGDCTDIVEGPYRFVLNWLTSKYDDSLRLRKVR